MSPPLGLAPASPLELAEICAESEDRANAETLPPPSLDFDDVLDPYARETLTRI